MLIEDQSIFFFFVGLMKQLVDSMRCYVQSLVLKDHFLIQPNRREVREQILSSSPRFYLYLKDNKKYQILQIFIFNLTYNKSLTLVYRAIDETCSN